MKKILLGFAISFCLIQQARAQKIINSFGTTCSFIYGSYTNKLGYKNDLSMAQYYITYSPRYNFVEMDNSSFSISAPIGLIIDGYYGTYNNDYYNYINDSGWEFGYDLPLVIDFNIGSRSTGDNYNHIGAYIGAGYDYEHINIFGTTYSNTKITSMGPIARVGYRWCTRQNNGITIGAFFKQGTEKDRLQTIGLSILVDR